MSSALERIAATADRAGVMLDFDGTLAPIVARPEDAGPAPGAREAIAALVRRYRLVAVISGRPTEHIARLVGVEGVRYEGLYGLPVGDAAGPSLERVQAAASSVQSPPAVVAP